MKEEISVWLASARDYETGVKLFSTYGQSKSLKRILERSEPCGEHLDTIVYELSQLLDQPLPEPLHRKVPSAVPTEALVAESGTDSAHADSLADRVLFDQIKEKLKYRDICHALLSDERQTTEQRRVNALLILDLSDQITEDYERHEHFKKHNVLPPAKEPVTQAVQSAGPTLERIDRDKKISNVRSKISFYKKKVKDAKLSHKAEYNASLVEVWQKALDELLAQ